MHLLKSPVLLKQTDSTIQFFSKILVSWQSGSLSGSKFFIQKFLNFSCIKIFILIHFIALFSKSINFIVKKNLENTIFLI